MRHIVHSRLCRRQMCGICLNTTGSRTRGYSPSRASRLSDAPTFRNKDNQKGVWKTRTWIAGGFQASGFYNVRNRWRLKDAKLNSRGLLSPWKPRHTPTENRLEDGNRQRIQRIKVDGHADHTLYNWRCFRWAKANNLFQHLAASLILSFSADRSWNKFRMTINSGVSSFVI